MAGFQVYSGTGKLQFSSDTPLYFLRQSGVAYVENVDLGFHGAKRLKLPTMNYPEAIVAVCGGGNHLVGLLDSFNGYDRYYITNAPPGTPFEYFIFDRSSFIPASGFGLNVFDGAGNVVFSTAHQAARFSTLIDSNNYPFFDGTTVVDTPGTKQAACFFSLGGFRNIYDIQEETGSNGQPAYYYQQDMAYWGVRFPGAGTIAGGLIPYHYSRPGPFSSYPDATTFGYSLKFLTMDVTNMPVGGTFF